jgi:glucose/arabinose dehydrogenase
MKKSFSIILILITLGLLSGFIYLKTTFKSFNVPFTAPVSSAEPLPFNVPDGFKISVFASGVENARVLAVDPTGTLLVSQPSEGKVVALPDADGDGVADKIVTVADGLNKPHGIAFKCNDVNNPYVCTLYIAETDQVSEFSYDAESYKAGDKKKIVDLPSDGYNQHYTRTLLFMPARTNDFVHSGGPVPNDNTLLISVGSSCNVCLENDDRRAKILAYDVVTKKTEEFAKGLRNAVFAQIHPVTGKIWATEMGRDGLGDDVPPDEINIVEKGKNYGWPICYGKNNHDSDFDKNTYIRNPCMTPFETPSHIDLQAHSAPLGLAFIPEEGWPEEYWHNLLVAYHGSWNRSVPTGYKIVRFKLNADGSYDGEPKAEDFITGFVNSEGKRIGRPVDIKVFPGGKIYISNDQAGMIYKVIRN